MLGGDVSNCEPRKKLTKFEECRKLDLHFSMMAPSLTFTKLNSSCLLNRKGQLIKPMAHPHSMSAGPMQRRMALDQGKKVPWLPVNEYAIGPKHQVNLSAGIPPLFFQISGKEGILQTIIGHYLN